MYMYLSYKGKILYLCRTYTYITQGLTINTVIERWCYLALYILSLLIITEKE